MAPRLAYIANGQLRCLGEGDRGGRDFDSPFAAQVRERAASMQRRGSWKEGGSSFAAEMAKQRSALGHADQLRFVDVARGFAPGEMVHALHTGATSGIFVVDAAGSERRILHTELGELRHVAARPGGELLACAVLRGRVANIAVIRTDGADLVEVTEGDSLDLAPAWVPGPGHRIVFQSAGLPRGAAAGRAPFSIEMVDADAGELRTLAEDPDRDLLLPRMAADGTLYYIRCPHRAPREPLWRRIGAIVTWPVWFAVGVFAYLDYFARMKQGGGARRARSGGAPPLDDVRMKDLLVDGVMREGAPDADDGLHAPAAVSSAWELVRVPPGGSPEVVATRVFAFDLGDDGTLAWTDGSHIRVQRPGGEAEDLVRDHLVHDVAWLG